MRQYLDHYLLELLETNGDAAHRVSVVCDNAKRTSLTLLASTLSTSAGDSDYDNPFHVDSTSSSEEDSSNSSHSGTRRHHGQFLNSRWETTGGNDGSSIHLPLPPTRGRSRPMNKVKSTSLQQNEHDGAGKLPPFASPQRSSTSKMCFSSLPGSLKALPHNAPKRNSTNKLLTIEKVEKIISKKEMSPKESNLPELIRSTSPPPMIPPGYPTPLPITCSPKPSLRNGNCNSLHDANACPALIRSSSPPPNSRVTHVSIPSSPSLSRKHGEKHYSVNPQLTLIRPPPSPSPRRKAHSLPIPSSPRLSQLFEEDKGNGDSIMDHYLIRNSSLPSRQKESRFVHSNPRSARRSGEIETSNYMSSSSINDDNLDHQPQQEFSIRNSKFPFPPPMSPSIGSRQKLSVPVLTSSPTLSRRVLLVPSSPRSAGAQSQKKASEFIGQLSVPVLSPSPSKPSRAKILVPSSPRSTDAQLHKKLTTEQIRKDYSGQLYTSVLPSSPSKSSRRVLLVSGSPHPNGDQCLNKVIIDQRRKECVGQLSTPILPSSPRKSSRRIPLAASSQKSTIAQIHKKTTVENFRKECVAQSSGPARSSNPNMSSRRILPVPSSPKSAGALCRRKQVNAELRQTLIDRLQLEF